MNNYNQFFFNQYQFFRVSCEWDLREVWRPWRSCGFPRPAVINQSSTVFTRFSILLPPVFLLTFSVAIASSLSAHLNTFSSTAISFTSAASDAASNSFIYRTPSLSTVPSAVLSLTGTSSLSSANCLRREGAIVSRSHPTNPLISSVLRNDAAITSNQSITPFITVIPYLGLVAELLVVSVDASDRL